jgi:large-conductance mechanosensitive channel
MEQASESLPLQDNLTNSFLSGFNGFMKFLSEKNVINLGIGLIFTLQITSIINSLVNNIISPIINRGLNNNSTKRLSEYRVNIGNDIYLEIGVAIMVLLRAFIIFFVAYLIYLYFESKKTQ